jgi:hypothetical protein
MTSMTRARRVVALALLSATTVITIGAASTPAQAMPSEWYRCWISGHGWMWCQDV